VQALEVVFMTFQDFIFDFEELLLKIEVLSRTLNAVSEQLTEDLNEGNGLILYGLEMQMLEIEGVAKDLFNKGFDAIKKENS
jgi:hypothetical protein